MAADDDVTSSTSDSITAAGKEGEVEAAAAAAAAADGGLCLCASVDPLGLCPLDGCTVEALVYVGVERGVVSRDLPTAHRTHSHHHRKLIDKEGANSHINSGYILCWEYHTSLLYCTHSVAIHNK